MTTTVQITDIIGKTISHIEARQGSEECILTFTDDTRYRFYHEQDCCENVYIEDIIGELADLLNEPLLMAEEVSNDQAVDVDIPSGPYDDSRTWTFYKFATVKGYVTFRWLGTSNGYYSESVDYGFMPTEEEELKKKN